LEEIRSFRETYRRECQKSRIDYVPLDTSMPFDRALMEYLVSRRNMG
jgi:phage terminase large subunit-like protein